MDKHNSDQSLVSVITSDGIELHGLLARPSVSNDTIKIHIHGTAASFFNADFYSELMQSSLELRIAFLSTNNRGSGVYEVEIDTPSHGAALEKFEDCLYDIDSWIEYVLSLGYTKIILEGHSFGTEKIIYYINNGKYRDKIIAIILMGFCDTVGTQERYEKEIGKSFYKEALDLHKQGLDETLLADLHSFAGEVPISSQTYINFFSEGSVLSKVMPIRNGNDLPLFENIHIPILGVIGDNDEGEYTIIPIKDAIELLERRNDLAEVYQVKDCDHNFTGKEKELSDIINSFTKRRILSD